MCVALDFVCERYGSRENSPSGRVGGFGSDLADLQFDFAVAIRAAEWRERKRKEGETSRESREEAATRRRLQLQAFVKSIGDDEPIKARAEALMRGSNG